MGIPERGSRFSSRPGGRSAPWIVGGGLLLICSSPAALAQQMKGPVGRTPTCVAVGCHQEMEQFKVSHEPVQKQQCLECHEYTDEVKHLFSLQESASALCLRCHTIMQGTSMHEPITSGDCLSCHSSHGSEFPGLLALDPLDNLCTRCHEEDYSKRLHIHGPVAARACVCAARCLPSPT